jgi:hypothetical protein
MLQLSGMGQKQDRKQIGNFRSPTPKKIGEPTSAKAKIGGPIKLPIFTKDYAPFISYLHC